MWKMLKKTQKRATKIIGGLEQLSYEDQLKHLGLLSLEKHE